MSETPVPPDFGVRLAELRAAQREADREFQIMRPDHGREYSIVGQRLHDLKRAESELLLSHSKAILALVEAAAKYQGTVRDLITSVDDAAQLIDVDRRLEVALEQLNAG